MTLPAFSPSLGWLCSSPQWPGVLLSDHGFSHYLALIREGSYTEVLGHLAQQFLNAQGVRVLNCGVGGDLWSLPRGNTLKSTHTPAEGLNLKKGF